MLIFFVFVKLLSLMTNTRERQPDYSGWQTGGRGDPCVVNDPTRGYGIFIENMLEAAVGING